MVKSAFQLVHFLRAPAGMNSQTDNARRDLVDQARKAFLILRGKFFEQTEAPRPHEQFTKQTLQALCQSGVNDFKSRSLIGVWP